FPDADISSSGRNNDGLKTIADVVKKDIDRERLQHQPDAARLQRHPQNAFGRVPCHQQHFQARPLGDRCLDQLQTVQTRQSDIADQQVNVSLRMQDLESRNAIGGGETAISLILQDLHHQTANRLLILDHQNHPSPAGRMRRTQSWLLAVGVLLRLTSWQEDRDRGPSASFAFDFHRAAGLAREAVDHRQAKACSNP
ncbi:MAG: hypothetical protein V4820_16200, partial [Pseudomonadota bacterium]